MNQSRLKNLISNKLSQQSIVLKNLIKASHISILQSPKFQNLSQILLKTMIKKLLKLKNKVKKLSLKISILTISNLSKPIFKCFKKKKNRIIYTRMHLSHQIAILQMKVCRVSHRCRVVLQKCVLSKRVRQMLLGWLGTQHHLYIITDLNNSLLSTQTKSQWPKLCLHN